MGVIDLSRIKILNGEWQPSAYREPVYVVKSPHALTQAIGYLKFVASQQGCNVYFRGQSTIYDGMRPSLYRGIHTNSAQHKYHDRLNSIVNGICERHRITRALRSSRREALLQHYGLRTTWIDLVDNVWIALWFACYKAISTGKFGRYLHFERRRDEGESEDAFIVAICVDAATRYNDRETTEFVDLRREVPSIFLRPHAQHGVLFRVKGSSKGERVFDYSSRILSHIKIDLSDALRWLGEGAMLDVHTLFPPAAYDFGYRFLLEDEFDGDDLIGSVAQIGT